jgi:Domain of unknown function (DUF4440)
MKVIPVVCLVLMAFGCKSTASPDKIAEEVWQREIQYWDYVVTNNKKGYLTLWHKDFIGYPSNGKITKKDKIGDWLAELHDKKGLHYQNSLIKKAVNPYGDIVITFYDEVDILRNDKNDIVSQEKYRITHTWKKFGDEWLIIGGMSAIISE